METLVWTVMMYGAKAWMLRKTNEKIRVAEMWFYRMLLHDSWTQKRTNRSILEELGEKGQLLELVIRKKFIYFGHTCQHRESVLMKLMFQGKVQGRSSRGHPQTNYISYMKSCIGCNNEQLFILAQERERGHEAGFNAARAANIKHDDAVTD